MKLVVSKQPAAGSQQTVDMLPASARNFTKTRSAIGGVFKLMILMFALIVQTFSVLAQNNNDTNIKTPETEKQYHVYETTYTKNVDTTFKTTPVDMAGTMRSNGKIYVVVTVLVIILLGLIFYLVRLDRKITRLEKGTWKDT